MGKIVAIGGGEHLSETIKIDKEIIKLTGKKNPKLLFIPTASSDSKKYYENIEKHFGKNLGCKTDVLYLIKSNLSKKEIADKILKSDIIYVGGGNTLKMMTLWRKMGIDNILIRAYKNEVVLAGLSAGAICWFRHGNSDSKKLTNPNAPLIKVTGLGIIDALCCPHYNTEVSRKSDLKNMMRKNPGIAIALDDCSAIEIINNSYRIIYSKNTANAYRVYWKNNKFYEEKIEKEKGMKSLDQLLSK